MPTKPNLVALLVLLFLLISCAPQETPLPATPTPTLTWTPTIVWFPPTQTPTPHRSPTPQPTPNLRPTLSSPLLEDALQDPKAWMTGRLDAGVISAEQQRISLSISQPLGSLLSLRNGPVLTDFYLQATAALNLCQGEDVYGLAFRASDVGDLYRLLLRCDGQARLERTRAYQASIITNWTPLIGVPVGAPQKVKIGIWVSGREMRIFVNDHLQFAGRDAVWTEGRIGVFARAASNNPVSVSFEEIQIWAIDALSAAPLATPTP